MGSYKQVPTLPQQRAGVLQYGVDFLEQVAPFALSSRHGGFITSCVCHGCPWSALSLDNKSSYQHYADWFYGVTRPGAQSFHVDPHGPDGDGSLTGPAFSRCNPWHNSPPPSPPSPHHRGVACPALSEKGCSACIGATDARCPGHWCGQPCIHTSQPVGRGHNPGDCFPANWWVSQHTTHPTVSCSGNSTGCQPSCNAAPPAPPGPPRPNQKPPVDMVSATYLTDYPNALCLDGSPGYYVSAAPSSISSVPLVTMLSFH